MSYRYLSSPNFTADRYERSTTPVEICWGEDGCATVHDVPYKELHNLTFRLMSQGMWVQNEDNLHLAWIAPHRIDGLVPLNYGQAAKDKD